MSKQTSLPATRNLTPFEESRLGWEKNAHIMQVMVETQLLVEGLEKANQRAYLSMGILYHQLPSGWRSQ